MLSKKQLQNYCILHGGHLQCRYLAQDDSRYNKWLCTKLAANYRRAIDKEVKQFEEECKKNGQDVNSMGRPIGNPKCSGYPLLKSSLLQGYDQKS